MGNFVAVSMDPDTSYPKKFLEDPAKKYSTVFPLTFAVAHDDGKKIKDECEILIRGTMTPPHAFLLNKEGNVVWHQDHSELGATVPTYMALMEKQLDLLLKTGGVATVGERPVEEEE